MSEDNGMEAAVMAVSSYRRSLQKRYDAREEEIATMRRELDGLIDRQYECKEFLAQCDRALRILREA